MSKTKRTTMGIIGSPRTDTMSLALASVLITGAGRRAKRTQAEEDNLVAKMQAKRDEEVRQARILKNMCPDCSGKLIRGSKQKKHNYKRGWRCIDCNQMHLM